MFYCCYVMISDVAYTSFLKRAIKTCWHTLEQTGLVRRTTTYYFEVLNDTIKQAVAAACCIQRLTRYWYIA